MEKSGNKSRTHDGVYVPLISAVELRRFDGKLTSAAVLWQRCLCLNFPSAFWLISYFICWIDASKFSTQLQLHKTSNDTRSILTVMQSNTAKLRNTFTNSITQMRLEETQRERRKHSTPKQSTWSWQGRGQGTAFSFKGLQSCQQIRAQIITSDCLDVSILSAAKSASVSCSSYPTSPPPSSTHTAALLKFMSCPHI